MLANGSTAIDGLRGGRRPKVSTPTATGATLDCCSTGTTRRYPRPGSVNTESRPSTLRNEEIWTLRLFSSTTVSGHTSAKSSSLLASWPRRRSSASSTSKAREPRTTRSSLRRSSRRHRQLEGPEGDYLVLIHRAPSNSELQPKGPGFRRFHDALPSAQGHFASKHYEMAEFEGEPENHPMAKLAFVAVTLAATLATSAGATADIYPSRPITVVVPGPAGGPPDTLLRLLSERMREALGQPLVIENA